jgi:hypothetical protein
MQNPNGAMLKTLKNDYIENILIFLINEYLPPPLSTTRHLFSTDQHIPDAPSIEPQSKCAIVHIQPEAIQSNGRKSQSVVKIMLACCVRA